jgi:DNA-directed RNA polymerase subunit RPC12/RpoP
MLYHRFECAQCGKRFLLESAPQERGRRFDLKCPQCKGRHVQRRFSPLAVRTAKKT